MSNNATFDKMLQLDGPLTVERFVELNWWGEKTLADLESNPLVAAKPYLLPMRAASLDGSDSCCRWKPKC
jgi:hypothetical protein